MGFTQHRGRLTEAIAGAYLELVGIMTLSRNERIAGVEIDLVGRDRDTRVLVEVKFRSRGDYGGAALAVHRVKQDRLRRAARALGGAGAPVRIDVVAIELEPEGMRLRHIRNAVTEARGSW